MGERRIARELALQALYKLDMLGDGAAPGALGLFWEHFVPVGVPHGGDGEQFAREIVAGVEANRARIDELIAAATEHWKMPRLSRVDLSVLRLATFELLARPEIPTSVTLNEAIEIARRYGSEDSPSFVNGVLDHIAGVLGVRGREGRPFVIRAVWICIAAALAGCGYHLAGTGNAVPPDATTMSVAVFGNHSREPGLEVALRRAIEEEFRSRGPLTVVPDPDGELVISGTIRRFQSSPVAFTGSGEAVQFQGIIQIAFKLVERATGKVLYENKLLQESLDFGATSNVVVTTSPRFQRGTINARDLAQMTNVQLSETRRRDTLTDLLDLLARDVYVQSLEGF